MRCGELVKALEMMKTHVQTTTPDATLAQAVDLMDLYQTPSLPVINEAEKLVGIITERDIFDAVAKQSADVAKNLRVDSVMSKGIFCINETQPVANLATLLLQSRFKRVPVVTDAGRVIGMLNRVDVLQALFEGSVFYDPDDRS